ncbi:MAG: beta-N-acetylhexosaminidase [Clostridium sp.]|nr:beta-N-acetylhexosaminidase [Clostridium sp.]
MIHLIPAPTKYTEADGSFTFTDDLKVNSAFTLPLLKLESDENGRLIIQKDDSLKSEAYKLEITKDNIIIQASDETGAYYALQSLRQLSRYELGERTVRCCVIEDAPRFKWRGLQLDSSRHFWSVAFIKKYLDIMFMMKLNVFHWHITDDQGWRLEIKKYPLLTEIGSVRKETQINGWQSKEIRNKEYSGYYTQEEVKELVEYAKARSIMIVPEIDFPAHCAAAIAAYPQLACRELNRDVPGYFGSMIPEKVLGIKDWNRTICAGKAQTIQFVKDVIDEACTLFPAPYFHIGGDEAPKDEWKKCPHCQKTIRENGLKNEEDLQGWFNNLILEHLKEKGRQLIGWNEILAAGNLDKSVIAQYWTPQRDKNAERHANTGGSIIMSNHHSFYFDMPYAKYPLKYTYDYTPEKFGVNKENVKNVLGVEGEAWTEWIDTEERLQMMVYPRVQALSEVAWTEERNKNWADFKARLDAFKPFFKQLGVNYAVDKISLPANLISRLHIARKFFTSDTHLETKRNKIYIDKGEK